MKCTGIVLVAIINILLITLLLRSLLNSDSDKSGIVLIFGYTLIVTGNLVLWGISSLLSKRFAKPMGKIVLILVLLFVPVLIFALQY